LNGDGDATELDSINGVDPITQTADTDFVFGDDGSDVMWGGRGDDDLWGGWGDDFLDVRPRRGLTDFPDDPPLWFTFGRYDFYQGYDFIYGGWDADAMQANVAAPGPRDTDELVDWAGGYNVYYVCPGAYGAGTITRQLLPAFITWMQQVSDGDGAVDSATKGTSGFREIGIVFPKDIRNNSNPVYPDFPGHFVCN
jgi:Ca2+-binding RTX toxin-like protein